MVDVRKLTDFVENYFFLYGIDDESYYEEENGEWYFTVFPDGEVRDDIVDHLTLITGLTREELFEMKKESMEKYYHKYSFFKLNNEFENTYERESRFLDFDYVPGFGPIGKTSRYDVSDLKKRIIRKTMEINRVIEGTYHPDAYPVGLCYSTEWMCSFPKFRKLATSLFRMVLKYRDLFNKAIDADLEDEEIREMNFLASALDMRDLIQEDIHLHYYNVVKLRGVYHTEKLKDFLSYVKIGRVEKTKFWRCAEFLDDKKLAWIYINMYPGAFSRMRQYLMRTENFSCWFYWSDNVPDEWKEEAEKIRKRENENKEPDGSSFEDYIMSLDDEEYDEYVRNNGITSDLEWFDDEPYDPKTPYDMSNPNWIIQEEELDAKVEKKDFLGIEYINPDYEWSESLDNKQIHLYIEKKPAEQPFTDRIRRIIQPAEKGGFPTPKRECVSDTLKLDSGELFDRRAARVHAMAGGA